MALLIPDARRGLLGGLIDDTTLFRSPAPSVERVVEAYRALRAAEHGWMVGRLVVPASHLEELAGVLVGTMKSGDAPVPITALFDGETSSNASIAAAVHATLDPAARIELVYLKPRQSESISDVAAAVAAGNGIHQGVLSMVAMPIDAPGSVDAIAAASIEALRPVGVWMDLRSGHDDPSNVSSMIRTCAQAQLPFSIAAGDLPALTRIDRSTGGYTFGALNLLAATMQAHVSEPEVAGVLSDDGPQIYRIEFGGLTRNGEMIHSRRSAGADRSPLISLATPEPADTIAALATLGRVA